MQVKLTHATYNVETGKPATELDLARIAGICYDNSKSNMDTLINCLKSGHMEPFEHVKYTFFVDGLSRDGLQELARHDIGVALTVRGTRFNDDTDTAITIPDELLYNKTLYNEWIALNAHTTAVYEETKRVYGTDVAKGVLPGATKCKLFVSFDLLALMHFLSQRMCERAHFDIRGLANMIYNIMEPLLPTVIGKFSGPPCKTGKCREKNPCLKPSDSANKSGGGRQ